MIDNEDVTTLFTIHNKSFYFYRKEQRDKYF